MTRPARKPRPSSPQSAPAARSDGSASLDVLGEHGGVTFRRERLAPILREIMPLLEKDWRENGVDHDALPLAFNYQQYLDYDLIGVLQIVTARDGELLVGYVFAYVHPHIDHAGKGWAIITWYWIYPEYRHGGIGRAMLEAMLQFLREAKVSAVEASEKIAKAHGLFTRLGFVATDVVYRKLIP